MNRNPFPGETFSLAYYWPLFLAILIAAACWFSALLSLIAGQPSQAGWLFLGGICYFLATSIGGAGLTYTLCWTKTLTIGGAIAMLVGSFFGWLGWICTGAL